MSNRTLDRAKRVDVIKVSAVPLNDAMHHEFRDSFGGERRKEKVVMNEVAPIILVFAMFFTSLLLVIAAVVVWGVGDLKRVRLSCAATQLNDIVKLANEALKSGSKEQQSAVNDRIDEWDKRFGKELGVELTKLAAA